MVKKAAKTPATKKPSKRQNPDLQVALRRAKERREAFKNELNKLTFKSTSKNVEERITKILHGKHPAYQEPDEHAELVECRQTLLLALLVDHFVAAEIISEPELDHMLLWIAKEA